MFNWGEVSSGGCLLIISSLRGEQLKFRLLWIGIFGILLLFATVTFPPNALAVRSLNRILLLAAMWHLVVFFTPVARKLGGTFKSVAILIDVFFISWVVRVTGGFRSEFALLYFVEILLTALFTERSQLLLSFIFSVFGQCTSLLSFHAEEATSQETRAIAVRFGHWTPEDLSSLGLRTVALLAVYLVGCVGRAWQNRSAEQQATAPAAESAAAIPPSVPATPVIESARNEAKQLSHVGEQLSIIAHELRSPLTILRAYTDLLMDPSRDTGTDEIVTKIDEEVTQLSEMVSNLGAIVDEHAPPSPETVKIINLPTLLGSLVEKQRSLSHRHEIVLRSQRVEIDVEGDRIKLTRAFTNLLGNAVKYSPGGGHIEVSIEVQQRRQLPFARAGGAAGAVQACAVVRISDSGIGMSPQAVSSAFEKFRRLDSERTRNIPGTGFGLYLTRKIVEQHQGTINLESVEGRGTTVTVALPLFVKGEARA